MRRRYFAAAIAIAWMALLPSRLALAQQPAKTPLSDDVSREDLFQLMQSKIKAAIPENEVKLFAFAPGFRFSHDAEWRSPVLNQDPRVNQVFGVDVSHHNTDDCKCAIDWTKLAGQKVLFAYLKASQGTGYYDGSFDGDLRGLRNAGAQTIHVGAYHFLSADGSGADQAKNFLDVTANKITSSDLAPVVDIEWDVRKGPNHKIIKDKNGHDYDFWTPIPGPQIVARLLEYLRAVQKATGKVPVVYTSQTWWEERIGKPSTIKTDLAPYKIWISDLSSSGLKVESPGLYKGPWAVWQFSFSGTAEKGGLPPGGTIDVSVFPGTDSTIQSVLGAKSP